MWGKSQIIQFEREIIWNKKEIEKNIKKYKYVKELKHQIRKIELEIVFNKFKED